jgi:glycosyltransferase involved in cell wall biosynthesis
MVAPAVDAAAPPAQPRMRVLQLHTRYRQAGGEDRVVAAEAELLRSAGHEVEQLVTENPETPAATAAALLRSPWNAGSRRAVERVVGAFRPDVAHVHNTWFALSPSVIEALRAAAVPTVMTVHNYRLMCLNGMFLRDGGPCTDCLSRVPWPGVRHRCYRDSAIASTAAATTIVVNRRRDTWGRGIRLFLAPTEFVRARMLDAGFPADRVRVKPHFVADPGPRTGRPSQSRTVLHVGRLSADKGTDALLDAWAGLVPTDLELVCIGDGPLRPELAARRVPGVRFLGTLPPEQVRAEMLRARALVATSTWYETFGLVVAEAMAAGLPVVVPRGGALADVAADAAIGAAGDAGAPADAALVRSLRCAADDSVVDTAGARGRARYLARFTVAEGLTQLMSAYRSAMESPAGSPARSGGG